jgi:ABC-type antimicrobial peptide transport system permease subunit
LAAALIGAVAEGERVSENGRYGNPRDGPNVSYRLFGGLALLLAAVGLYGIVAHAVRARQTEIGLRMALGAAPSSIVRLVFERVGVLIAAGLAFGLAGSLWAVRFVETLLFRMEARDPATFAGAAAALVAVGVLAAWLSARRAARLDPATVLREG